MLFVGAGENKINRKDKLWAIFNPSPVPVWQMIDFFISPLNLRFEMDELPQVVAVHIFWIRCPHLNLCHRDQDLEKLMMSENKYHLAF